MSFVVAAVRRGTGPATAPVGAADALDAPAPVRYTGTSADRVPWRVAPARGLARARGVELDLLLRGRENARALAAGCALGLLHQIAGSVLRLLDDVAGALARLTNDGVRLVARLGELLLALLRGREPLRDLARAL